MRRGVGLVVGLAAVLVAAFVGFLLHQVSLRRAAAIDAAIENGPLVLSLNDWGGNATGSGWKLQLDAAGNVTLKMNSYPTPKTRQFVVPKPRLDDLREALQREQFFDLDDAYGQQIVDSSSLTVKVSAGEFSKTVDLHSFVNWVRQEPERLRGPSRALRVVQVVLGWFDDTEMIELRNYDQTLIDAAK
jgi:hypothetical protein